MYNFTPLYLSRLVPETVSNMSRHSLRNSKDLQTIATRSSQYYHSFLLSITRDWNSLSIEAKQSNSVISFKHFSTRANQQCLITIILVAEKPRFFILVFVLIAAH